MSSDLDPDIANLLDDSIAPPDFKDLMSDGSHSKNGTGNRQDSPN